MAQTPGFLQVGCGSGPKGRQGPLHMPFGEGSSCGCDDPERWVGCLSRVSWLLPGPSASWWAFLRGHRAAFFLEALSSKSQLRWAQDAVRRKKASPWAVCGVCGMYIGGGMCVRACSCVSQGACPGEEIVWGGMLSPHSAPHSPEL